MSELKVRVKSLLSNFSKTFEATDEDTIGSVKQFLLSCSILEQPITSFTLKYQGVARPNETLLKGLLADGSEVELELDFQKVTFADVSSQIERLREVMGLGFAKTNYVNAGATRIDEIKPGSKKGKLSEDELSVLVQVPDLHLDGDRSSGDSAENPEGKETSNSGVPSSAAVSYPNPLVPKPAAIELKLSHWHPLCQSSQLRLKGIIAFIVLVSNDKTERYFIATRNGFAYVPSLTSSDLVIPENMGSVKFWPTLVEAIEHASPSTISSARKRSEQILSDLIGCSSVPQVSSVAPWLVGKVPKITSLRAGDFEQSSAHNDWNEDFQSTRELEANSYLERIVRERSLCHTATAFASAATEGSILIVEGAVPALNPLEDDESAKLYLHKGIFYTYGSDFAQAYAGIKTKEAAQKAVKKGIDSVEQLMLLNIPELCPVLTAVIDYCGRRVVAQAPVPGIFRDVPLVVYGQSEEPGVVHYNEDVAAHMKKFAEHLHLKKHPVTTDGLELETSAEVHGAKSPDGRYYAIDLHRMQVPDLLFEAENDLDLLRYEAVVHYFSKNPDAAKLNPDVWMPQSNFPKSYVDSSLEKDIEDAKAVAMYVREEIVPALVNSIADESGINPVDGVQLTELMHRNGINMKHLGRVYNLAKSLNLKSLGSVAFEEALARSLKHELREVLLSSSSSPAETVTGFVQGFRGSSAELDQACLLRVELRLKNHFGFSELPPTWKSVHLPRTSLLRLLSVKMGLQWNEKLEFVGMHPIVRFSFPRSVTAAEAIEAARLSLIAAVEQPSDSVEDQPKEGDVEAKEEFAKNESENGEIDNSTFDKAFTILEEAVELYSQIYGFTHSEMAQVLNQVATLFFEYTKDTNKAIEYVRKAIKISERVKGIDSFNTLVMYTNLAAFERSAGNWVATLQVAKRIVAMLESYAWAGYADAASIFETVAVMLLQSQRTDLQSASLSWFARAIELRNQHPSGPSGVLSFQYAQAQIVQQNYVGAARSMEAAYSFFKTKNGVEDPSTKEVKSYLDQLLKATVVTAKNERADALAALNGATQLSKSPAKASVAGSKKKNKKKSQKKKNSQKS